MAQYEDFSDEELRDFYEGNLSSEQNKASIPIMITNKMRAQLRGLGYTNDQINAMKPSVAWEKVSSLGKQADSSPNRGQNPNWTSSTIGKGKGRFRGSNRPPGQPPSNSNSFDRFPMSSREAELLSQLNQSIVDSGGGLTAHRILPFQYLLKGQRRSETVHLDPDLGVGLVRNSLLVPTRDTSHMDHLVGRIKDVDAGRATMDEIIRQEGRSQRAHRALMFGDPNVGGTPGGQIVPGNTEMLRNLRQMDYLPNDAFFKSTGEEIAEKALHRDRHPLYLQSHLRGEVSSRDRFEDRTGRNPVLIQDARSTLASIVGFNWEGANIVVPDRGKAARLKAVTNQDTTRTFKHDSGQVPALRPASGRDDVPQLMPKSLIVPHGISPLGAVAVSGDYARQQRLRTEDVERTPIKLSDLSSVKLSPAGDWVQGDTLHTMTAAGKEINLRKPHANEMRLNANVINFPYSSLGAEALVARDKDAWDLLSSQEKQILRNDIPDDHAGYTRYFEAVESANFKLVSRGYYFGGGDQQDVSGDRQFQSSGSARAVVESYISARKPMQWGDKLLGAGQKGMAMMYKAFDFFGNKTAKLVKNAGIDMVYMGGEAIKGGEFFVKSLVQTLSESEAGRNLMAAHGVWEDEGTGSDPKYTWKPTGDGNDPFVKMTMHLLGTEEGHAQLNEAIPGTVIPDIEVSQRMTREEAAPFRKNKDYRIRDVSKDESIVSARGPGFVLKTPTSIVKVLGDHKEANINLGELRRFMNTLSPEEAESVIENTEIPRRIANSRLRALDVEYSGMGEGETVQLNGSPDFLGKAQEIMKKEYPESERNSIPYSVKARALYEMYGTKSMDFDIDGMKFSIESPESLLKSSAPDVFGDERNPAVRAAIDLAEIAGGRDKEEIADALSTYRRHLADDIGQKMNKSLVATGYRDSITTVALQALGMPRGFTAISHGFDNVMKRIAALRFPAMNNEQNAMSMVGMSVHAARDKFKMAWDLGKDLIGVAFSINGASWDTQVRDEDMDGDTKAIFELAKSLNMDTGTAAEWTKSAMVASGFGREAVEQWERNGSDIDTAWQMMSKRKVGPADLSVDTKFADFYSQYENKPTIQRILGKYFGEGGKAGTVDPKSYLTGSFNEAVSKAMTGVVDINNEAWNAITELTGKGISQEEYRYMAPALGGMKKLSIDGGGKPGAQRTREIFKNFSEQMWESGTKKSVNSETILGHGINILNSAAESGFASEDLLPLFRNGDLDETDPNYQNARQYVADKRKSGERVSRNELMEKLTGQPQGAAWKEYAENTPIVGMGYAMAHKRNYGTDTSRLPKEHLAKYIEVMRNFGGNNPSDSIRVDRNYLGGRRQYDPEKIRESIQSAISINKEFGGNSPVVRVVETSSGWTQRRNKARQSSARTPASTGAETSFAEGTPESAQSSDGDIGLLAQFGPPLDYTSVGTHGSSEPSNSGSPHAVAAQHLAGRAGQWGITGTDYVGPAVMRHGRGDRYSPVDIIGWSARNGGRFSTAGGTTVRGENLYAGSMEQFYSEMPTYAAKARRTEEPGEKKTSTSQRTDWSGERERDRQRFFDHTKTDVRNTPGLDGFPGNDVLDERAKHISSVLDTVSKHLDNLGEHAGDTSETFVAAQAQLKGVVKSLTSLGKTLPKPGSINWTSDERDVATRANLADAHRRQKILLNRANEMKAGMDLDLLNAEMGGGVGGNGGGRRGRGGGGGNPLMNRGGNPNATGFISKTANSFIDNFGAAGWLGWAAFGFNRINNIAFGGIKEDVDLYRQDVAASSQMSRVQNGYEIKGDPSLSERIGQMRYTSTSAKLAAGEYFSDYRYAYQEFRDKIFSQGSINTFERITEGGKAVVGGAADLALGTWALGKLNEGAGGFLKDMAGGVGAETATARAADAYRSRMGQMASSTAAGGLVSKAAGLIPGLWQVALVAGAAYLFREPIKEAADYTGKGVQDWLMGRESVQDSVPDYLSHTPIGTSGLTAANYNNSIGSRLALGAINLINIASGRGSAKFNVDSDGNFTLDRTAVTSYSNGVWDPNDNAKIEDDREKARNLMTSGADIRFPSDAAMVDFVSELSGDDPRNVKARFSEFSKTFGLKSSDIESTKNPRFKLFASAMAAGGAEDGGYEGIMSDLTKMIESAGLSMSSDEAAELGLSLMGMASYDAMKLSANKDIIRGVSFRTGGMTENMISQKAIMYGGVKERGNYSSLQMATAMSIAVPTNEYAYNVAVQNGIIDGAPTMDLTTGRSAISDRMRDLQDQSFGLRQAHQDWSNDFSLRVHDREQAYTEFNYNQGVRSSQLNFDYSMSSIGRQRDQANERFSMQMAERGISEKMMLANFEQQTIDLSLGRERSLIQRGYQDQDFSYSRDVAGIKFGWNQEDFSRNIRLATGREKRQLMRERDRSQTMFGMEEDQANRQKERRDETRQWEDEDFQRKKNHFETTKGLQIELFNLQTAHMARSHQMQLENIDAQIAHIQERRDIELENEAEQKKQIDARNEEWEEQYEKTKTYWQDSFDIEKKKYDLTMSQEDAVASMNLYMSQIAYESLPEMVKLARILYDLLHGDGGRVNSQDGGITSTNLEGIRFNQEYR